MYNKTLHALISRINPKINPTLRNGHSALATVAKTITFPIGMAGVTVDEANSVFTGCTPFYITVPGVSYSISVSAGEINKLVLDDGTILIPTPGGFKDVSGKGNNATSTTMTMSHISDSSVFHCEEYGFAVKSGVIYPALLDGTGYAGLVGAADKYFPRGLISRRGSIDIEAWNYLDTLIDFGGSSGVLSAGIIINQFDGTDCNDDLITTAETKLDPAEIAILVPASGDDIELDKNFTVSGTSNCANVKIEASADGTTWVTLAASVAVSAGAFSKADCQLPSADFDPNDEVTIRVSDVDSISLPDTVEIDVASSQAEWMQYPSTGGNTYPTASIIEGDYIYLGGPTSATSVFGETTGIGGAVDVMYWVGKFKKSDFSKVWVKFFDNSLVDALPGENLANAGDNLAFVLMTSANIPTAYLIAKSNGNTVTTANLSVSGSTETRAYNMVASSNYLWTVGYTYISGAYDTHVWRLNHDLSNVVKTATSFYGVDYSNECRISSNGNYLIVNEQSQFRLKVIDISTGTPSALSTEFSDESGIKELPYCTRTNSNRWMLFCQYQNSPYTLSLRRRSLNDLATVIYNQDYGSQASLGRAGDVRYFNSKFYICYKDVANSRFRIERIADSDTYTLEASINIIPNTYTDALLKQHSFNNFDGTKGVLITGLKGKIEADATASGTYYDVVFKLFDLP